MFGEHAADRAGRPGGVARPPLDFEVQFLPIVDERVEGEGVVRRLALRLQRLLLALGEGIAAVGHVAEGRLCSVDCLGEGDGGTGAERHAALSAAVGVLDEVGLAFERARPGGRADAHGDALGVVAEKELILLARRAGEGHNASVRELHRRRILFGRGRAPSGRLADLERTPQGCISLRVVARQCHRVSQAAPAIASVFAGPRIWMHVVAG